jgi:hypothetical protein
MERSIESSVAQQTVRQTAHNLVHQHRRLVEIPPPANGAQAHGAVATLVVALELESEPFLAHLGQMLNAKVSVLSAMSLALQHRVALGTVRAGAIVATLAAMELDHGM